MGSRAAQAHKAGALELRPAIKIQAPKPTIPAEITRASAFSIDRSKRSASSSSTRRGPKRSYVEAPGVFSRCQPNL
jgi:hypothetical protein